jgi:hypothetical protein
MRSRTRNLKQVIAVFRGLHAAVFWAVVGLLAGLFLLSHLYAQRLPQGTDQEPGDRRSSARENGDETIGRGDPPMTGGGDENSTLSSRKPGATQEEPRTTPGAVPKVLFRRGELGVYPPCFL